MLEGQASRTALATAFARAVHVQLDAPPPVLDDRLAIRLLPSALRRAIVGQTLLVPEWLRRRGRAGDSFATMRMQIVVRGRYAEDCLTEARQHGAGRYIVLGAGLDTFALRQIQPCIDVLEIDHPDTQRWKAGLLAARGIPVPPSLTLAPVDFEQASLADAWPVSKAPDFISWLGTTYYLKRESIESTLATLAECTLPGTELVLDYWRNAPMDFDLPLLWGTRVAVALSGEPMRSFFEPVQIADLARAVGWDVVEDLGPAQQRARYLAQRRDRLDVPSFAHLLRLGR